MNAEEKAKLKNAWVRWLREVDYDLDEKPWEWYSLFVQSILG